MEQLLKEVQDIYPEAYMRKEWLGEVNRDWSDKEEIVLKPNLYIKQRAWTFALYKGEKQMTAFSTTKDILKAIK